MPTPWSSEESYKSLELSGVIMNCQVLSEKYLCVPVNAVEKEMGHCCEWWMDDVKTGEPLGRNEGRGRVG